MGCPSQRPVNFCPFAIRIMAANAANAVKLAGVFVLGPAAFIGSIQGAKMYRNFTSTEEDNRGHIADATRKQSVVDRFTLGPMKHFDAKYLEKQLKTNSALRDHADDIRIAHAKATK